MRDEDKKKTAVTNEPTEKKKTAAKNKPTQKKKNGKKKKKSGMPTALVVILIAVVLIFGVVAGYGVGRKALQKRLTAAESQLGVLTEAYEESERNDDLFDAQTNLENEAALSELAGEEMEPVGNDLLGGDSLEAVSVAEDANAVVVAEFDGGKVMSDEAGRAYEEQLAAYVFEGYTEEEISGEVLDGVLEELVTGKILQAQAQAAGIGEPSAEEESELARRAQEIYDESVRLMEDVADGVTEEEARTAAVKTLEEDMGVTYETTLAACRDEWRMEKLYAETVKDATVADAEVEQEYNARVAAQKEAFEANVADYEEAQANGELIMYHLPNRRLIGELLIGFDEGVLDEVLELSPANTDAYYAAPEKMAQAALAELKSGAAFEDLQKKYDPNWDGAYASISADSTFWSKELVDAAMALEKVGDVSEPMRVENGVMILYYAGDVTPGAVSLDAVKEEIRAELLMAAQYDAYNQKVQDWIQNANVKYYPERMQ